MTHHRRVSTLILGLIISLLFLLMLQSIMTPASAQTVLLGVIAGLMAMLVMQPSREAEQASIEYKTVSAGSLNPSLLDEFGREGWRLVCVDQAGTSYIFVR